MGFGTFIMPHSNTWINRYLFLMLKPISKGRSFSDLIKLGLMLWLLWMVKPLSKRCILMASLKNNLGNGLWKFGNFLSPKEHLD